MLERDRHLKSLTEHNQRCMDLLKKGKKHLVSTFVGYSAMMSSTSRKLTARLLAMPALKLKSWERPTQRIEALTLLSTNMSKSLSSFERWKFIRNSLHKKEENTNFSSTLSGVQRLFSGISVFIKWETSTVSV